ncbi:MAG: hypothetical protein ACM30I_17340 [Gemmatimonas sp.]
MASKASPSQKRSPSPATTRLTPSEVNSLREETKAALARAQELRAQRKTKPAE